jgi:RES domain-containing protein
MVEAVQPRAGRRRSHQHAEYGIRSPGGGERPGADRLRRNQLSQTHPVRPHPTNVYRVLRKAFANAPLDGEGAYRYGGRWSSVGIRLSYASEHQSLAMLEYFVHLEADDAPPDVVLVTAEVPANLSCAHISAKELCSRWRESPAPAELARIGDNFVKRAEHCILLVPSALAPSENNWLINPYHPDFRKVSVASIEPLRYDPRMFAAHRRIRRKR